MLFTDMTGLQFDVRDGGDGGECFPPEPFGNNAVQILRYANF